MIIHSYNGGGIRGLMIAFTMRTAEVVFGKAVTPNIYAGTSVGSIIATLRALGYEWLDICKFFSEYGPQIFKRSCLPRILRAKYSDKNINAILKKYIGEDTMLSDVKGCVLLIPTVDVSMDMLKVWTNVGNYEVDIEGNHAYSTARGEDAKLWEVVRASCSAPRYFNRSKINGRMFEDGGLKANNPSLLAYSIARIVTDEPICVLSVTTGRKAHKMKESEYNDGVQVASHVIDSTLDAIDKNTHFALQSQMRPIDTYFRIEMQLAFSSGEVDDVSPKNMRNMMKDSDLSFEKNYSRLSAFSSNPSKLII